MLSEPWRAERENECNPVQLAKVIKSQTLKRLKFENCFWKTRCKNAHLGVILSWGCVSFFNVLTDFLKCLDVSDWKCYGEFVPTECGEQVRTLLRVNGLGWMQNSQEPFEERARKKYLSVRGGNGKRRRWRESCEGEAEMTSAVLLMTWSRIRGEMREKKGDKLSKED